jgi:hypothetical protein
MYKHVPHAQCCYSLSTLLLQQQAICVALHHQPNEVIVGLSRMGPRMCPQQ